MNFARMAAFAVLAALAAAGSAGAQPPVEAFGRLPFMSQPQLSPDGKHFAALQDLDGKPAAVIYQVNAPAGTQPQVFGSSDWLIAGLRWVKNDRVVMLTKNSKTPMLMADPDFYTWYRSISLDVNGSAAWVQMFSNINSATYNTSTGIITDKNLDDPDTILMPLWATGDATRAAGDEDGILRGAFREFRLSLFRVDVHTGRAALVQDGVRLGGQWITDGHGNIVARIDTTPAPLTDHVMLYQSGSWRDVKTFDARADRGANVAGLTFDGKSLAYAGSNAQGRDTLARLDLDSGQLGATLLSNPQYDVADAIHDEWTGRVIGGVYYADQPKYVYFDPARDALQNGIEAVFPGKNAFAVSVTQDGSKAIVAVSAPDTPRTYYFLDRDTHVASKIVSEYPDLAAADLGAMKPYPYKARDGLDIQSYLTLPPGKAAKNLPMVVLPHGGPDARDGIGFDWWAQFLANRGYLVFQPNYRGSKGYGHAFTDAGLHQWGLKMQDDIGDGVKKLIADGLVDPKRVCIVGANFGGYAALAGATFTPDLYACAASIAGISDLSSMLRRTQQVYGRRSSAMSFWESRIGTTDDDAARLAATSPALHADQVRVPILLMHGLHDTAVNYAQSEEERDALLKAGKTVQMITFEADDHYLSLAETRIQTLRNLEVFLKANIGQ